MPALRTWLLVLVAASATLLLAACADDSDDAEEATAVPATDTTPAAAPVVEASVVEQLRANADAFSYEIGTYGGTITTATIGKPLTFNLALATTPTRPACSATCSRG